ncbi:hemolysin family protein [Lyngbya confervoides]|uniref:Hemolysin family protein n=1 Tax=Lyngbya confervoides BDU141951 TaxID=1574623 RepID=A0ABD4T363_9CYAN|nr:hemolysin family protein [Lyngbya confervoides]MCM1982928.1 hemolysin family protein [Lyngbya confervoides BDU141951]
MTSLIAILALIAINAFFVTAEFSIVIVRRSRIQQLVLEGDAPAKTVQNLQRDLNRLLSTTQIGITLSCLALGWISERTISSLVSAGLSVLQVSALQNSSIIRSLSILLVFLSVAYLQIVLGELGPKSLALRYSEYLARSLGPLSLSISNLLYPFIWLLNRSTEILLSMFGIQFSEEELYGQVTTKELQLMVEASAIASNEPEEQLLRNFFEFGEITVRELMVPRTNIEAFPVRGTYAEFLALLAHIGHESYPVIDQSLDDVQGILKLHDLATGLQDQQIQADTVVSRWVQPPRFVNENTSITEALELMYKHNQTMLMVREEDVGGTAGLIHLKDILGVIISDPEEDEIERSQEIQQEAEQLYSVQAQTSIESINEQLGINLPFSEEYQTVGGFLLFSLQKVPQINDQLVYENLEFTVTSLEGPRLERIQVKCLPAPPETISV